MLEILAIRKVIPVLILGLIVRGVLGVQKVIFLMPEIESEIVA